MANYPKGKAIPGRVLLPADCEQPGLFNELHRLIRTFPLVEILSTFETYAEQAHKAAKEINRQDLADAWSRAIYELHKAAQVLAAEVAPVGMEVARG